MVTYCSAYGCKSSRTKDCRLTFHSFPKDPELRKKWTIATRREGFVPTEHSRLCSNHFTEESYQIRPNASYRLLKEDAVPTIFNFPAHLTKTPTIKRRAIVKQEEQDRLVRTETASASSTGLINVELGIDIQESQEIKQESPHTQEPRNVPERSEQTGPASAISIGIIKKEPVMEIQGSPDNTEQKPELPPTQKPRNVGGRPKKEPSPTEKHLRRTIKTLQKRLKRRDVRIAKLEELLKSSKAGKQPAP